MLTVTTYLKVNETNEVAPILNNTVTFFIGCITDLIKVIRNFLICSLIILT